MVSLCDETYPCAQSHYLSSCGDDEATPVCTPCPTIPNCAGAVVCSASDLSARFCTQCLPGYFWDGSKCDECLRYCPGQCSDSAICTVKGVCTACGCPPEQYMNGEQCESCTPVANCQPGMVSCTSAAASLCSSCAAGFFRQMSATNGSDYCIPCSTQADDTCFRYGQCSAPGRTTDAPCEVAQPGYYINPSNPGPALPCDSVPNCAGQVTCDATTSSVCAQCASGYYADGGVCVRCSELEDFRNCRTISECGATSNARCTSCDTGYMINGTTCTAVRCTETLATPANSTTVAFACDDLSCLFQCVRNHVSSKNKCECNITESTDLFLQATCGADGQWQLPDAT